jgi:hypothetical protein
MPRKLRVEYAGAMYHVMSRGDQGEDALLFAATGLRRGQRVSFCWTAGPSKTA